MQPSQSIKWITNGELSHGVDIIKDLYEKTLARYYPPSTVVPANRPTDLSPFIFTKSLGRVFQRGNGTDLGKMVVHIC